MSDSTKQRWLRTGLWAAALGLSVSACVPVALVGGAVAGGTLLMSADRRSSETQTADSTIESAAHEAIVKLLPGRGHVNVNSYYRKVLITGEVPTAQDKQTVEAAVRALPGVQSVVSDLAVMPESTAIQRSNDGLITSKVRARFVGTNGIPAGSIKIFTEREGGVPEVRNIQPIYSPLFAPVVETFRTLSARPGLMFIALLIALAIFWLVA